MTPLIELPDWSKESPSQFYVHLLSGVVEIVGPADRVQLDATSMRLMDGEVIAASYARSEVEYCSRENIDIPYL